MKSPSSYQYVPAEHVQALLSYQYRGVDLSLVYRHILTPMNNFLLQFVPKTLAPNLITMISLLLTMACSATFVMFSPDFNMNLIGISEQTINQTINDPSLNPSLYQTIQIARVLCAVAGLVLFLYQTLDNLDGKQARRTGSSSPLGLLFDHGVDCLNVTVSTLIMMNIFQFEKTGKLFCLWLTVSVPFFFATWEEYFTNELILPVVNGPTDGVLLSVTFCLIGAFKPGFWGRTIHENFEFLHDTFSGTFFDKFGSYQTHWLILIAGFIGVILTISGNIYRVASVRPRTSGPLSTMMSVFLFNLCSFVWIIFSPSSIFQLHPVKFLFMIGFLFCNLVCKLMLAHLCSAPYKAFRYVLIPYISAVCIIFTSWYYFDYQSFGLSIYQVEYWTLIALLVSNFSFWLHFVTHVIAELTEILNIYVFSIQKKPVRKLD